MRNEQNRYKRARSKFIDSHIGPAKELLEATANLVNIATTRAEETKRTMEQLRPVWAQGFTSDSQAAQANGNALAEIWQILGVDNQTAAMEKLRKLVK